MESVALEWKKLPRIDEHTIPAVIPVRGMGGQRHFVALLAARDGKVKIQNFPEVPTWISEQTLRDRLGWDGKALHVAREKASLLKIMPPVISSQFAISVIVAIAIVAVACVVPKRRYRATVDASFARRSGVTLMDLVVAMAIVALLMSLLMPAVERSREAARKLSCQSSQKQIGLAIANFADGQNRLPNVETLPLKTLPSGIPVSSNTSILALLLPYIDQSNVYRQLRLDEYELGYSATGVSSELNSGLLKVSVPLFQCPSDGVPAGGSSYVFSCGTSPGLHGNFDVPTGDAAATGYVGRLNNQYASLTDGLSQTVILSERLVGDLDLRRYTPTRDNAYLPAFNGFSAGTAASSCTGVTDPPSGHFSYTGTCWLASGYGYTWYNHVLTPNSRIPDCSDHRVLGGNTAGCHTARSAHLGGVNATLGDGSVRFVSSEIDLGVWRALGTCRGNEVSAGGGLQ